MHKVEYGIEKAYICLTENFIIIGTIYQLQNTLFIIITTNFKVTSSGKYAFNSPHTVIIVRLT